MHIRYSQIQIQILTEIPIIIAYSVSKYIHASWFSSFRYHLTCITYSIIITFFYISIKNEYLCILNTDVINSSDVKLKVAE